MEEAKRNKLKEIYIEYTDKTIWDIQNYELEFVLSEGNMDKGIMMIGEAPGKEEVLMGKPFTGMAGGNLSEFMEYMHLKREDIFLTNTIKYRLYDINPKTGKKRNRPATKKEIEDGRECLLSEIEIIKPKLILTLGNVPLRALTGDDKITIGAVHGKPQTVLGTVLIPLYHPASIIYNRKLKTEYLKDLDMVNEYISN
jgi:DNA polymerase